MSALVILILVSTTVAAVFLIAFIWSVRSGQYDDTQSPSVRILMDKKKKKKSSSESTFPDNPKISQQ